MPNKKRIPCRVISSVPLTEQEFLQVVKKAEATCHAPVEIEQVLDPKVISGFRLELPDCVIDCTLDSYLDEIQSQLLNDDSLL